MKVTYFLKVAVCLTLAGCIWPNSSNTKVIGGSLANEGYFPAVINLLAFGSSDMGLCTGTFISKHHILTAAHCLVDSSSLPPPPQIDLKTTILGDPERPKIFFATGIASDKRYSSDVRAIYVPEKCLEFLKTDPKTWQSDKLENAHDLAVVEIVTEAPAEVVPAALYDGDVKVGTPFRYVGYGFESHRRIPSDAPVMGDPRKRLHPLKYAVSKVDEIIEGRVAFAPRYTGLAKQSGAPGDSGGPVYFDSASSDGEEKVTRILGVTSFVQVPGENKPPNELAFTLVSSSSALGQWIRDVLAKKVNPLKVPGAN